MISPPAVAIVHYHFRRGGVTRVVENALTALDPGGGNTVVLSGEPAPEFSRPERLVVVPELAYDPSFSRPPEAESLVKSLKAAARRVLGRPPDVWHIHNHSLGKNAALPAAVAALAIAGEALLLQIHDFAEDGRPENYRGLQRGFGEDLGKILYPLGPRIRYACLNDRDAGFLRAAGCPSDEVILLPNAVPAAAAGVTARPCPPEEGGRFWLYPTRSIRRKNLGELLLWSLVYPRDRFGCSLAPENPSARPIYDRWVSFAGEADVPVEFEMGRRESYEALLERADAFMTTSMAEGFGLAFLESWTLGREIAGRDLPEITRDFARAGLTMPGLYPRLEIPLAWVGEASLRERLAAAMPQTWASYGRSAPVGAVEQAMERIAPGGRVDFGRLDETLQESVLSRLIRDRGAVEALQPGQLLVEPLSAEAIQGNADRVAEAYGLEAYGQSLSAQYRALLKESAGDPPSWIDPGRVLEQFLQPERFTLIRTF